MVPTSSHCFIKNFLAASGNVSSESGGGLSGLMSAASQMGSQAMMTGMQVSQIGVQMALDKAQKFVKRSMVLLSSETKHIINY